MVYSRRTTNNCGDDDRMRSAESEKSEEPLKWTIRLPVDLRRSESVRDQMHGSVWTLSGHLQLARAVRDTFRRCRVSRCTLAVGHLTSPFDLSIMIIHETRTGTHSSGVIFIHFSPQTQSNRSHFCLRHEA